MRHVGGGEPRSFTTEQMIRNAEFVVAGEMLAVHTLGDASHFVETPTGSTWRVDPVRVEGLFRVDESLKGKIAPGAVVRIVQYDVPSLGTAKPRDIADHPRVGAIWFLNRSRRGTYTITFEDAVTADTDELRAEIALYEQTRTGLNALFVARNATDVAAGLAAGLQINAQDYNQDTALHWAIEQDRGEVVRALLDNHARHDILDAGLQNALDVAIDLRREDLVVELRRHGATAHGLFLLDKPLTDYGYFLSQGADVNAGNRTTPVIQRITDFRSRGSTDTAKLQWLLENGASPSNPNGSPQPLHETLAYCDDLPRMRPVAALLLGFGADINAVGPNAARILTNPVLCGDFDTVEWLVAEGAHVNAVDECGFTVLFKYIEELSVPSIRRIVALGANLDRGDVTRHWYDCDDQPKRTRDWLDGCRSDPDCADIADVLDPTQTGP